MGRGTVRAAFLAIAVAFTLLGGIILLTRRDELAPLGAEIRYDEFGFAVDRWHSLSERTPTGGLSGPRTRGIVLEFRVENRARVVPFSFDPTVVILTDSEGQDPIPGSIASGAVKRTVPPWVKVIPAGQQHLTTLFFDLPKTHNPRSVRIAWGGAFVEAVDRVFCGDARIALEP